MYKKNGVYSYLPLKYFQIHLKTTSLPISWAVPFLCTVIFKRLMGRQSFTDLKTPEFDLLAINLHTHAAAMWSLP